MIKELKPTMLPPPRPQLEMPLLDSFYASQPTSTETAQNGISPSTPKIQPVKSSTLPLPSPFPTETNSRSVSTPLAPLDRDEWRLNHTPNTECLATKPCLSFAATASLANDFEVFA